MYDRIFGKNPPNIRYRIFGQVCRYADNENRVKMAVFDPVYLKFWLLFGYKCTSNSYFIFYLPIIINIYNFAATFASSFVPTVVPKKEETTLLVKLLTKSFLPFWAPLYFRDNDFLQFHGKILGTNWPIITSIIGRIFGQIQPNIRYRPIPILGLSVVHYSK